MRDCDYFDHASTTRVDERALEAMRPYWGEVYGNASSLHSWGLAARAGVERARGQVAGLLGCEPEQVLFCGGATEALNWWLGFAADRGMVGVSPFEHSAGREAGARAGARVLEHEGWSVRVGAGEWGCVVHTCNETGGVPAVVGEGGVLFRDVTQAAGKVEIDFGVSGWAGACLSGHKFHGPKGVGVLVLEDPYGVEGEGWTVGGGQEGVFSGTVDVAGVVGTGVAAEVAAGEMGAWQAHAAELRGVFLEELRGFSGWSLNDAPEQSVFIMSVTVEGLAGQSLVVDLDSRGFGVSAGAACSSRSVRPSPVLLALGRSEAEALGTVRVSFAACNTKESTRSLAKTLKESAERLRGEAKR